MQLPTLSLLDAITLCSLIAATGIVYNAVEFISERREILEKFYDWRIVRSRYYILIGRPILGWLFDALFSGKQFHVLIVIYGVAAILFPFVVRYSLTTASLLAATVLLIHCLSHIKLLVGMDGADQMQTIIWSALFFVCLPVNEIARLTAISFIAVQFVLSYLVSGWAKLLSPIWRKGTAISKIMRTATYSTHNTSRILTRPSVSFCLSWATIILETSSPVLLLLGRPGALFLIVVSTTFHLGIAILMGLTTFVFAFCAALPILYFFTGYLNF
ncbi:MAG: hypothetical protein AAFZ17_02750 [Cyanobacteria bacterium J06650_10]